jgi:hypothetical protein
MTAIANRDGCSLRAMQEARAMPAQESPRNFRVSSTKALRGHLPGGGDEHLQASGLWLQKS